MKFLSRNKENSINLWQLGIMLGTGMGLPVMLVVGKVSQDLGPGTAISSILIGNLLLWVIGLGVLGISKKRIHAIEITKDRLGEFMCFVVAVAWIAAFAIWYAVQIETFTDALKPILPSSSQPQIILRIGTAVGFITALISMFGFRVLKWVSFFSLPLLMGVIIYTSFTAIQAPNFSGSWGISFSGILSVILIWLPGMLNLPTLFRYAKSKADATGGLVILTALHIFFQLFAVLSGITDPEAILAKSSLALPIGILFIFASYACVNIANNYFAAAAWGSLNPETEGENPTDFTFFGMIGTMIYFTIQSNIEAKSTTIKTSLEAFQTATTLIVADLGITLLISSLISRMISHRTRPREKLLSSISWVIGVATAMLYTFHYNKDMQYSLVMSCLAIIVCFAITLFVEEARWAIKHRAK